MSSLTIRRLIVWAVSAGLGFLTAYLIITVGFAILPSLNLPPILTPVRSEAVTIEQYGIIYFICTAGPLALLYLTWLDHFMGTRILPD
jgi:inner membrane protein involved in colicin E2 resistance